MATIGSLNINLSANTTGFAKGLKSAQDQASGFGSSISSALGKVAAIGAGIAGAIGFGALIRGQLQAVDATGKLAESLGLSTEGLVGLQHAASLANTSNEDLTTGLSKLSRNIGEANQGNKAAIANFSLLGLNAQELSKVPLDQALGMVADRINLLGDESAKSAMLVDIFGKSGQTLSTLIAGGSKSFAEATDWTKRFGLSFTKIEFNTVQEAVDRVSDLKEAIIGLARRTAIGLAPLISAFATGLTTAVGFVVEKFRMLQTVVAPIGAKLIEVWNAVTTAIAPFLPMIASVTIGIVALGAGFKLLSFVPTIFGAINGAISIFTGLLNLNPITIGILAVIAVASAMGVTFEDVKNAIAATVEFLRPVWDQLVNVWSAALEVFRGAWESMSGSIMGILEPLFGWIQGAWEALWGFVGPIFTGVKDAIIMGLIAMEFAFQNWRDVLELAALKVLLGIVTFANQVVHFFTVVIPAVTTWFANNWRDIFTDVFNFTATVFTNLANNIVNIVKNIPGLITGAVSFSDLWTPLTDGFESSLKELPEIAERQMGPLEESLSDQVDGLQANLGAKFEEFAAGRLADLNKPAAEAVADAGKIEVPKAPVAAGAGAGPRRQQQLPAALLAGSAEALATINRAMFDQGTDVASQQLAVAKQQQKSLEAIQAGQSQQNVIVMTG
jgi:hypothetical protein